MENPNCLDPAFRAHLGRHMLIALTLGLGVVLILVFTAPDIGLTWDEPAYIVAAESYIRWFDMLRLAPRLAMAPSVIEYAWKVNHEHPPLDKIWSGWVWSLARAYLDDLTAHRLGNILLVGGLAAMLYLMTARHYGLLAGLMAVLSLMSMPRFFFHAHLAALDVPAAVAVFATTLTFWLTHERQHWGWDILLGFIWGLALATKVNAVFIPCTLLVWTLVFQRHLYLLRRLAIMGVLGPPVFVITWPWLYDSTQFWPRLMWYLRFVTIDHWKIGQYYLGRFWRPPPWHFPFVMTLAVVPLTTLLSAILGGVLLIRSKRCYAIGGLLIFSALTPLMALAFTGSMVYDNERLFMPTFPYIAALGGIGTSWLMKRLRNWIERWSDGRMTRGKSAVRMIGLAAVAGLMLAPQLISAGRLYPHLLSYYAETIGGLCGATCMGLESTYWCETYAAALPYLNAHAGPGQVIWVDPWSHDVLFYYQRKGHLRTDLRISWPPQGSSIFYDKEGIVVDPGGADWVLVQYRQTGFNNDLRRWLNGREPILRLEHQGIPLMELYKNE